MDLMGWSSLARMPFYWRILKFPAEMAKKMLFEQETLIRALAVGTEGTVTLSRPSFGVPDRRR